MYAHTIPSPCVTLTLTLTLTWLAPSPAFAGVNFFPLFG